MAVPSSSVAAERGVLQRSYYLMREAARYHDVYVIAFRQRAHQPQDSDVDDAINAILEFAHVCGVYDLPEYSLVGGRYGLSVRSILTRRPFTILWGESKEYAKCVAKVMMDVHPEVVHFDTISLAPYLKQTNGVTAILNHHNVESNMLRRRASVEKNFLKSLYFWQEAIRLAAYERRVAKRFARHLACADLDADRLRGVIGSCPIDIVPNGVDLEYFYKRPEDLEVAEDTLIFVGGLSWYPNSSAIEFFLREVWPRLLVKHPNLEFTIVGRGCPATIRKYADSDRRVKLLGFVDDIRPLVHASCIYVCPIFDGGGTKLKMLDAMAMGAAIVAHPVACEGLGLTDGKEVFIASSVMEFVDGVEQLLSDRARRKQLGDAARSHVETHFGFCSIGEKLAKIYAETVDSNSSGILRK